MKLMVVILATIAFVFVLRHFMPTVEGVAFYLGQVPIKWWHLGAVGFAIFATKAGSK